MPMIIMDFICLLSLVYVKTKVGQCTCIYVFVSVRGGEEIWTREYSLQNIVYREMTVSNQLMN